MSKPSNAFHETEALRKDSKGINTANAVASAAMKKKIKIGKLCLGMERVLMNRGMKKISARMAKNTAESGATDAPWKSLAKAGKLVKGKHNNKNAQQISVSDCKNLGFIGIFMLAWDLID